MTKKLFVTRIIIIVLGIPVHHEWLVSLHPQAESGNQQGSQVQLENRIPARYGR
jgi:hypothetical protein